MERLISQNFQQGDESMEATIRPTSFHQYIGQDKIKKNLQIFIEAAKMRNETLDHVLLYGPPGLGKTTLAAIIASQLGSELRTTSGPAIERAGDLASILSMLEPGDVLFIDEIHRLPKSVEEVLYTAMEDFCIDVVIGKGPTAKNVRVDLPPFTLIGATTRSGLLSSPLRDRFGVHARLEYYQDSDLQEIVKRTAGVFKIGIDPLAAYEIARRSRGTPRVANRILRRVRDFAQVEGYEKISIELANKALQLLNVDLRGLDFIDHKIILGMIEKFQGGPVGIETIAATVAEEVQTIEEVYEPYLIQIGMIQRTPRGRVVTPLAYEHFGIEVTKR